MARSFVEAFLKFKPGAGAGRVRKWLEQQGLSALPIQAGLMVSGSEEVFNRVFACDMSTLPRPARLQPPAAVADEVELVEIPRPRYPMPGHLSP
jgi:hypothetical protein